MKAIVQSGYGTPEQVLRLGEIDRPSVGDGEVLVRMRASSVNTPDWLRRDTLHPQAEVWAPGPQDRCARVGPRRRRGGGRPGRFKQGDDVFGSSWADAQPSRIMPSNPAPMPVIRSRLMGARLQGNSSPGGAVPTAVLVRSASRARTSL